MQTEKEAQASENTAGSVRWVGGEASDPPRPPPLERKLSKRREVQEERTIVIDLFKELISKVNEKYAKIPPLTPAKPLPKTPKIAKPKPKPKPREAPGREKEGREGKEGRRASSQERRVKKEEIWGNYSVTMSYQLLEVGTEAEAGGAAEAGEK